MTRLGLSYSSRGLEIPTYPLKVEVGSQTVDRFADAQLFQMDCPTASADIVEQVIESLRLASEAKSVRVVAALDPHAGPIMGDPHRLQQVVWNLLSNALKFTPKGGRIRLTLERVDSNLRLVVSDTGQGMAPEFLPYVFERFKQADGATTRSFGGLGLGLAISRHIVDLHGGSISVARGRRPGRHVHGPASGVARAT